jgi:MFS superfamily sulfate permease-like transporter
MRIPLHSAAVVLIVNGWKQVDFKAIALSFKKSIINIIPIGSIFVISVIYDIFTALIVAIILNALISVFTKTKGGANNG